MPAEEPVLQVDLGLANQVIRAQQVPVEHLASEDRVLGERGLEFKAPEINGNKNLWLFHTYPGKRQSKCRKESFAKKLKLEKEQSHVIDRASFCTSPLIGLHFFSVSLHVPFSLSCLRVVIFLTCQVLPEPSLRILLREYFPNYICL